MILKRNWKKICVFLLLGALAVCLFAGCHPEADDIYLGGVEIDGKLEQPDPVISFGKYEIPFSYYRFIYLSQMEELANGEKDFFQKNPDAAGYLKDSVFRYFRYLAGFYALLDEYKVSLTDEERAAVLEKIASSKEEISGNFTDLLNQLHLTEALHQELVCEDELETKLHNTLFLEEGAPYSLTNDQTTAYYRRHFCRAVHMRCSDLKTAEKAERELNGGADFTDVSARYNQDPTMEDRDEGRYFVRGDNEKAYDDAAFALKEGRYSKPVKCSDGFYIIYRMPMDEKLIMADIEKSRNRAYSAMYNRLLAEKVKDIKPKFCSVYDRIGPDTVR